MNNTQLEKYAFAGKGILDAIRKMIGNNPSAASSLAGAGIGGSVGSMTGDGGLDNIALGALLGAGGGAGIGKLNKILSAPVATGKGYGAGFSDNYLQTLATNMARSMEPGMAGKGQAILGRQKNFMHKLVQEGKKQEKLLKTLAPEARKAVGKQTM